jgi:hypothetical protein
MKFMDDVWQTAEGMAIASPHHVFDLAVSETEVGSGRITRPAPSRWAPWRA